MLKLYITLLIIALTTISTYSQSVQSTIKKQNENCVEIFAKPSAMVNAVPFQIVVSLRWPDQAPVTVTPVISDMILGMVSTSVNQHTEGIYTYQDFIIDNSASTPSVSWPADSENKIAKICFEGPSDELDVMQQVSDDTGGSNGWVFWYINFEGLDDLTNYGTPFYASAGESTADNSGSIKWAETIEQVTLPLTLVDFDVTKENSRSARIQWTTREEQNVEVFEIERSVDGSNWEYVASVNAQFRNGFKKDYRYIDKDVYDGTGKDTYYYRLRVIDMDGKYFLTPIDFVTFSSGGFGDKALTVFPNPSSESVNFVLSDIEVNTQVDVSIFDIHGKLVYSEEMIVANTPVYLSKFTSAAHQNGIYHLWVSDTIGNTYRTKFILQR